MFFKTASRINPQTGKLSIYYRLVENSRNVLGGIYQRSIMPVGFMDDVNTEELHRIADRLNERIAGKGTLIEDKQIVKYYIYHLYTRLVKEKRIDHVLDARKKLSECDWQRVDMNSLKSIIYVSPQSVLFQFLRYFQYADNTYLLAERIHQIQLCRI